MPGLSGSPAVDATPITDAAQDVLDAIDTLGAAKHTINGGQYLIPEGPTSNLTVSSHESGNTYSAWTQMIATTQADLLIVGLSLITSGSSALIYVQTQIGIGGSGDESPVCTTKHAATTASGTLTPEQLVIPPVMFPTPTLVPAGSRIAVRVADGRAQANVHRVTLICVDAADLENF